MILYESTETEFNNNGIGYLSSAISVSVTEERNGMFELEFQYPVDGLHYSELKNRRIVLVKPSPNANPEPFRIYSISRPISMVITVYARHISYDLSGVVLPPMTADTITSALASINSVIGDSGFSFYTDKSTSSSFTIDVPSTVRSIMGGQAGSLLDVYGGEYEYNRFSVALLSARGQDNGVSIRYGKNLTDIQQEENIENLYTGVYPYWKGQEGGLVTLPEGSISVDGEFDFSRIRPLDLSEDFETEPSIEQLRTRAKAYMRDNHFGIPSVSIKVSFIPLDQTDEYKNIALLERVNLCDTVTVVFETLGVNTAAEVVKTVYNPLSNRYTSIEIGEARATITDEIVDQKEIIESKPSSSYVQNVANAATEWMQNANGGNIIAVKTDDGAGWKDFYLIDSNTAETAVNVMWLNSRGIALSNNGINGPYRDAWTLQTGFVADVITTGILHAVMVKIVGDANFYWDAANICVINPQNSNQQVRFGCYDGTNYGIGFTQDGGNSWQSAMDFNGLNITSVETVKTYRQPSQPSGDIPVGSLWYNTANQNQVQRWNGTAWESVDNEQIAANTAQLQVQNGQIDAIVSNGLFLTYIKLLPDLFEVVAGGSAVFKTDDFNVQNADGNNLIRITSANEATGEPGGQIELGEPDFPVKFAESFILPPENGGTGYNFGQVHRFTSAPMDDVGNDGDLAIFYNGDNSQYSNIYPELGSSSTGERFGRNRMWNNTSLETGYVMIGNDGPDGNRYAGCWWKFTTPTNLNMASITFKFKTAKIVNGHWNGWNIQAPLVVGLFSSLTESVPLATAQIVSSNNLGTRAVSLRPTSNLAAATEYYIAVYDASRAKNKSRAWVQISGPVIPGNSGDATEGLYVKSNGNWASMMAGLKVRAGSVMASSASTQIVYDGFNSTPFVVACYSQTADGWSGESGVIKIYNKTQTGATIEIAGEYASRRVDWIAVGH